MKEDTKILIGFLRSNLCHLLDINKVISSPEFLNALNASALHFIKYGDHTQLKVFLDFLSKTKFSSKAFEWASTHCGVERIAAAKESRLRSSRKKPDQFLPFETFIAKQKTAPVRKKPIAKTNKGNISKTPKSTVTENKNSNFMLMSNLRKLMAQEGEFHGMLMQSWINEIESTLEEVKEVYPSSFNSPFIQTVIKVLEKNKSIYESKAHPSSPKNKETNKFAKKKNKIVEVLRPVSRYQKRSDIDLLDSWAMYSGSYGSKR